MLMSTFKPQLRLHEALGTGRGHGQCTGEQNPSEPYLVGGSGIWAGVVPQAGELILQPGGGGVAQTVDDTGGQEDPDHGHDRDQGQHDERG